MTDGICHCGFITVDFSVHARPVKNPAASLRGQDPPWKLLPPLVDRNCGMLQEPYNATLAHFWRGLKAELAIPSYNSRDRLSTVTVLGRIENNGDFHCKVSKIGRADLGKDNRLQISKSLTPLDCFFCLQRPVKTAYMFPASPGVSRGVISSSLLF